MDFEKFADKLSSYIYDVNLSTALSLYRDLFPVVSPEQQRREYERGLLELRAKLTGESVHDQAVRFAHDNYNIQSYLLNGKKIQAIKELRAGFPGLGLKEAKDAIEDRNAIDPNYPPF